MRLNESGHALLYTTVFLPLIVGGAALAFDVSGINLKSERVQSALDSLVLNSAHYFPDSELVRQNFEKGVNQIDGNLSSFSVVTSEYRAKVTGKIEITEKALLLPKLLEIFNFKISNYSRQISSEAELLPTDLAIVLSDGVDQRPWTNAKEKVPWPEDRGLGRASSALSSCILPPVQRYTNIDVPKVWSESREWITQSCFNPVFSAFKLSAMNIAASVLEIGTNRAAVVFTPGSNGRGEVIRHGTQVSEYGEKYSGYSSPGQAPLATWLPFKDLEYELGDEACIVLSDGATASNGEYSLDLFTTNVSRHRACLEPLLNSKCGQPFSIGEKDRLDFECLAKSSLGEAIYWRSAKRPRYSLTGNPDFYSALSLALTEVLSTPESTELDKKIRGYLAVDPAKVIVLLTSVLPELDTSNPAIRGISAADVTLVIGYLRRPQYPSEAFTIEEQELRLNQWKTYLEQPSPQRRYKNLLLISESPAELVQNATPQIVSNLRRVLIRR